MWGRLWNSTPWGCLYFNIFNRRLGKKNYILPYIRARQNRLCEGKCVSYIRSTLFSRCLHICNSYKFTPANKKKELYFPTFLTFITFWLKYWVNEWNGLYKENELMVQKFVSWKPCWVPSVTKPLKIPPGLFEPTWAASIYR